MHNVIYNYCTTEKQSQTDALSLLLLLYSWNNKSYSNVDQLQYLLYLKEFVTDWFVMALTFP